MERMKIEKIYIAINLMQEKEGYKRKFTISQEKELHTFKIYEFILLNQLNKLK